MWLKHTLYKLITLYNTTWSKTMMSFKFYHFDITFIVLHNKDLNFYYCNAKKYYISTSSKCTFMFTCWKKSQEKSRMY